jgi:hypothetical protein
MESRISVGPIGSINLTLLLTLIRFRQPQMHFGSLPKMYDADRRSTTCISGSGVTAQEPLSQPAHDPSLSISTPYLCNLSCRSRGSNAGASLFAQS